MENGDSLWQRLRRVKTKGEEEEEDFQQQVRVSVISFPVIPVKTASNSRTRQMFLSGALNKSLPE